MNKKGSPEQRLYRLAKCLGVRTDAWQCDLPGVRSIEELDAQTSPLQACRCCGYLTLSARGVGERCGVCAWVDPGEGERSADANEGVTLAQARENVAELGVCSPSYLNRTRPPRLTEFPPEDAGEGAAARRRSVDQDELQAYRDAITIDPDEVPADLRDLIPLARKWGIGDDAVRGDATETATVRDREELVKALSGRLGRIDQWLASFAQGAMTGEVEAFMYLTEAVEELELDIPSE